MSLDEYWRKRDFRQTPEPRGARPEDSGRPSRRFTVQRHRATRLHYDFRLEIEGVLVSWAVPRGPSMRPLEKRMAARTEDHPIDYLEFEGIIPPGEYGGGDVIVWDVGTWEPEGPADPAASVEDGELKFVLHGERLKGRFVIVRTRQERRASEDWLLIHKRDEHAVEAWDIDAFPSSVLSGRTNDDVATGKPSRPDPRAGTFHGGHRSERCHTGADAIIHQADAGHADRSRLQPSRLAVRAEVGWLPRPGSGEQQHGQAVDAQSEGCGRLFSGLR